MKKTLTIALLMVMLVAVFATVVNATTASELANKLIKIIKEQNSKIKEAIDYIKGAYEMAIYTKTVGLEEDNIQDLLEILERDDK